MNSGKQCVLLNLPAFAVLENKGKNRLSFVNPGEREVLHRENSSERRETRHLPSVNRTVNSRKQAFSGVHRYGKLPDNGTNTRIHRPQNTWKILDFPIGEYQKMSANTAFCANSPRVFKTVNAMFFAVQVESTCHSVRIATQLVFPLDKAQIRAQVQLAQVFHSAGF